MLAYLWDKLIRLRTWLYSVAMAALMVAPDILNAPEVLAVIPSEYVRYFAAAAFLVNIALRWRPAARKAVTK